MMPAIENYGEKPFAVATPNGTSRKRKKNKEVSGHFSHASSMFACYLKVKWNFLTIDNLQRSCYKDF